MKGKKRIVSLIMTMVLALGLSMVSVFADTFESPVTIIQIDRPEPPKPTEPERPSVPAINVTVPTQLPTVTSGNNTLIGSFGSIKNNGYSSVKVKSIKILPAKGWSLVKGDTPKNKLGKGNKIGLRINNIPNDYKGNFNLNNMPNIEKKDTLELTWKGVYNTTSNAKEITAATVVFTIGY